MLFLAEPLRSQQSGYRHLAKGTKDGTPADFVILPKSSPGIPPSKSNHKGRRRMPPPRNLG
jgi:hypothetical protein